MRTNRVLLSEGSSLSSRQTITALGQAGYRMDLCDPDPLCLGRLSKFIRRFFFCPALGRDPLGYLRFITGRLATGSYDVLLPVHEQAFLFARAQGSLTRYAGLALPDFNSFRQVQSKVQFTQLLIKLGIPHPETQMVRSEAELRSCRPYPYFLKTEYGTASTGVWSIAGADELAVALAALKIRGEFQEGTPLLVQERVTGRLERLQAVFDKGRLVAWHGYEQRLAGQGGGDVAKSSVLRQAACDHVERLGRHLAWHGALSFDYFFDEASGRLWFIDGNPRIVEPMNGLYSGINLADVLVRVSRGEHVETLPPGRAGVRTHMTIMALLESAARDRSRLGLLRRLVRSFCRRGEFAESREELTPFGLDPPSVLPAIAVLAQLVAIPSSAEAVASKAVGSYSLSMEAVRTILAL